MTKYKPFAIIAIMEHTAYIRNFNEIYADLTAEELVVLYKWVQSENELFAGFAAYDDYIMPVTGRQATSNNISHKYVPGIDVKIIKLKH